MGRKPTDDPYFPMSFSVPLSKLGTIKEFDRKAKDAGESRSSLILKLVENYVEAEEPSDVDTSVSTASTPPDR